MAQMCLSNFPWSNWADLQFKVQMERWDGSVLDTNVTCLDFGQKFLQLADMLTVSHCDINPYPYGKENVTTLNIIS